MIISKLYNFQTYCQSVCRYFWCHTHSSSNVNYFELTWLHKLPLGLTFDIGFQVDEECNIHLKGHSLQTKLLCTSHRRLDNDNYSPSWDTWISHKVPSNTWYNSKTYIMYLYTAQNEYVCTRIFRCFELIVE